MFMIFYNVLEYENCYIKFRRRYRNLLCSAQCSWISVLHGCLQSLMQKVLNKNVVCCDEADFIGYYTKEFSQISH